MKQPDDQHSLKVKLEQLLSSKLPLPELVDMQLVDIISVNQLQQLQDEFSLANGITSVILDTNGKPVTKPSNCTVNSAGSGLSEASAPIYICGKHVADFKIEMRGFGGIVGPFLEAAFDSSEKYNEMHEKLSDMTKAHFESVCNQLKFKTEEISETGHTNLRLAHELLADREQNEQIEGNRDIFKDIFNSSTDGFIMISENGDVMEWSRGYEDMSGISRKDAIGRNFWNLIEPIHYSEKYSENELKEMHKKIETIIFSKKQTSIKRYIVNQKTKQKHITHAHYFPMTLSGSVMIGAIIRDITMEEINEQELFTEKERLQILSDSIPDGLLYQFVFNKQTERMRMTYVGANCEKVMGISSEDALANVDKLFASIHPDDLPILLQQIKISAQDVSRFDYEIRLVACDCDNNHRWIKITSYPHSENNKIIWNGIILECTEQKRTELKLEEYRNDLELQVKQRTEEYEATNEELYATNEELYATNEELHYKNEQLQQEVSERMAVMQKLEDSESKMSNFIEQSLDGIVIVDEEGKIIDWNPAQERITELPREEAIGKYCWDVFKEYLPEENGNEMLEDYRNIILELLKKDNDNHNIEESDFALRIPGSNTIRYVYASHFRMKTANKCYVGELIHDSTERKLVDIELERYRSQLEEMVALQTAELIENKERLTSLSDNLPGGVIYQLSDKNTLVPQFTYISAYFSKMFSASIESVMEDSSMFFRMLHPEDGAKLIDMLCSPDDQSSLVDIECRVILETGETKWIHLRWSYHMDKDGNHVWDGFMVDINDKKMAEQELDETRRRQNILIQVLQIVQTSENIHDSIQMALTETGKFAGVSRSYIFEKSTDGKTCDNTYEWCNEGINPEIDNLLGLTVNDLQTWFDVFDRGEYVCASDIKSLAPEVQEILEPQGIKSILVLPLTINGIVFGFVGFDECVQYKKWKPQEVELLISLSQIISTAIRRYIDEKSIKLSQQTMHTVLDNINAVIYVADFETNKILFANKMIKDQIGCDVEGQICWEALQGLNAQCEFCPKPKLLHDNKKSTGLYRWEFLNQRLNKWFECSDAAIEWVDGRMVHMEYATDITERKVAGEAMRRSEELYRQLTVASPDAIVVCNTQKQITYLSPKAKELFYMPEDDIGFFDKTFTDYVHPHDLQKTLLLFQSLVSGSTSVQPQLLLTREDGTDFFGEVSSAIVRNADNEATSVIMVIRDITERRMSEIELIRAKEKAEEADKLKSSFLANMSHEIRTPINGINGFLSFIADENLSPKRRHEYVTIVHNSCAQLIRIIDDIIDVAKIEAQQLNIRAMMFNLNEFMMELHTFFESYLQTNKKDKVALVLDDSQFIEPCLILSDPTRLRQVITNLIGNASKFTEKGFICFGYKPMPENKLEFWVEDTGIGMPANQLEVIFERFRQVELTNHRKYGGTGLGLTISRSLVQMMGGNIDVESIEEQGSTFRFTISYFPIEQIDEPVFAELRKERPEEDLYFPGTVILLVEPEVISSKYYEKILSYNGVTVIQAQTMSQWIDALSQQKHIDMQLVDARIFINEGEETFINVRSVRAGLPTMMIVPERNEFYINIVNNMQCNNIIEGVPTYEELSEELLRNI